MFLQQLVTGISVGGIYALLATGYSLIYSLLDFSNWAHGEFAMVSAYVAIVLSNIMGMPFVLAAIGGMMGGALVSFLCERLAYRRIRRNGAPNMFLMIAAMGLSNMFQQAANLIFSVRLLSGKVCSVSVPSGIDVSSPDAAASGGAATARFSTTILRAVIH